MGWGIRIPDIIRRKQYEEEMRDTEGSYSGIGVSITQNTEGGILVVDCYEGSPADEAGLKANDVITAVNGTDVTEMTQLRSQR